MNLVFKKGINLTEIMYLSQDYALENTALLFRIKTKEASAMVNDTANVKNTKKLSHAQ
jgi:hypothetical protein